MDLDGTLLDHDGHLCERNLAAMRNAAAAGVALAIVTGRRRSTFRKERDRFAGVAFRSAVSNGGVLLSTNNETVERVHEISWQGFLDVRRLAPQGAVKACMAITIPPDPVPGEPEEPDAFIITADGRFFYATAAWEPERQLVSQEFAVPEEVAMSRRLVHAAFHVAEPHFVNDLMEIVREHYREDASVYAMQPPRTSGILIDIVARGGKGLAVRDLAVSLGIPDDAIAAIGDGMNDFLLLEAAQFRYAVRGSALARRYAGAIEVGAAGAVADALERFLSELC